MDDTYSAPAPGPIPDPVPDPVPDRVLGAVPVPGAGHASEPEPVRTDIELAAQLEADLAQLEAELAASEAPRRP